MVNKEQVTTLEDSVTALWRLQPLAIHAETIKRTMNTLSHEAGYVKELSDETREAMVSAHKAIETLRFLVNKEYENSRGAYAIAVRTIESEVGE